MYKFVNTLTDSQPWIQHFTHRADTTTAWQPTPESSVVILRKNISKQGVQDPGKRLEVVLPVEQIKEQAKAGLAKEIKENREQESIATKRRKKQGSAKQSAAKVAKKTKDIFSKYREKHGK